MSQTKRRQRGPIVSSGQILWAFGATLPNCASRARLVFTPCAACVLAVLLAGCNRGGLNLAPAEGVVTLDGEPVADAGVMFTPVDPKLGPPASGATDAEGRFTLITANRPGAIIGEHRVAISKSDVLAIPQRRGLPLYKTKDLVPPKYGSAETSGLTATVADDDNDFKFDLSSK
jgi:hypothetical protein